MLLEGLILSVAGMGTVFLFLMLLVGMMGIIAKAVRVLEAKGLVAPAGTHASKKTAAVGADMAQIAAVIAIAGRGLGKH